jgi:magnesium chelatase family protein
MSSGRSSRRSAHNVLLLSPPGAGTSMLARRLTTILPAMTLAEALETTRIHRVAGLTGDRTALVTTRPFRATRHTISDVRLIGGDRCRCRRRCCGRACGMLPLAARPACRRHRLEGLRPPLEVGLMASACAWFASAHPATRAYYIRVDVSTQGQTEIHDRPTTRITVEHRRAHRTHCKHRRRHRRRGYGELWAQAIGRHGLTAHGGRRGGERPARPPVAAH